MKIADHALLGTGPARWRTPHFRYNQLAEADLAGNGYQILSHSKEAGADVFIKRKKALFVFLQGHPEYDTGALMREYRRDISRYLAGERDTYPDMPSGYFDAATTQAALEFRARAIREHDCDLLPSFQMLLAQQNLINSWRPAALLFFANFLTYLTAARSSRVGWSGLHRVPRRRARSEIAYA
jgi:homoserine O-succinyltransferase